MYNTLELLVLSPLLSASLLFILGCLLGSFANVIIVRLPAGESVVRPRSHCRECKKMVVWYQNIPIFSWLFLRGQCANCGVKFSFRYPLVEFLMGLLFALVFLATGWSWTLVEYLYFSFALVVCAFIDIDHMILPDKFTLSGIVIGLVGAALNPERSFMSAFYGVLMGGGFLWAVAYMYYAIRGREGMGGGDIKLLAWIGAVLGWPSIPIVILTSSLTGSVCGILLALKSGDGFKKAIPFGPYLVLAALFYIILHGQKLGTWYLSLHGLDYP